MRTIFVAGPYNGATHWETAQNIAYARAVTVDLLQMGYAVFCPHSAFAFMGGVVSEAQFRRVCIEWQSRSDATVMIPGWRHSEGSMGEWGNANQRGQPIRYWPADREVLRQEAEL